jgi:pentose-5-phosphate-3-epimerase
VNYYEINIKIKNQFMIVISPAIFTNDTTLFTEQLVTFRNLAKQIDIDITDPKDNLFDDKPTVSYEIPEIIRTVGKLPKLGFHLMLENPEELITEFADKLKKYDKRFYVHVESKFPFDKKLSREKIFPVVDLKTKIDDVEFYMQYNEIQLMTIETGAQGRELPKEVFKKVGVLREAGFKGIISLDGGINANTAHLVKQHDVNRVSVGSYLSKAENPIQSFYDLTKLLN